MLWKKLTVSCVKGESNGGERRVRGVWKQEEEDVERCEGAVISLIIPNSSSIENPQYGCT
jgi:hypothetical protein